MPLFRQIPKDNLIPVTVRDRTGTLFEGKVGAITSFNEKGEFDILAFHANFISLIKDRLILHTSEKIAQRLYLSTGVLRVKESRVEVYLGVLQ